jgi:hypothetical protein
MENSRFQIGMRYWIESIYSERTHPVVVESRTTDSITVTGGKTYPVRIERDKWAGSPDDWEVAQVVDGPGNRNAFISSERSAQS